MTEELNSYQANKIIQQKYDGLLFIYYFSFLRIFFMFIFFISGSLYGVYLKTYFVRISPSVPLLLVLFRF